MRMPNKPNKLDLREVNPIGRFDVLAYRAMERLAGIAEKRSGLEGIWPAIESEVQKLVINGLSGIEIPTEARIALAILQANMLKAKMTENK